MIARSLEQGVGIGQPLHAENGHERHPLRATPPMPMSFASTPPLSGRAGHDGERAQPVGETLE